MEFQSMKSDLTIELRLVQRLVVQARTMVSQGNDPDEAAGILDDAEYLLARLIEGDRTRFMGSLDGMMATRPEIKWALSEFSNDLRKQQADKYGSLHSVESSSS